MEFHHPPNFPEFLQPFRNLRIITQVSPLYRGLFLIGFRYLVGLGFHRFPRSIINHLRHWHWRDVTVRCIFSFSNRHLQLVLQVFFAPGPTRSTKREGRGGRAVQDLPSRALRVLDLLGQARLKLAESCGPSSCC